MDLFSLPATLCHSCLYSSKCVVLCSCVVSRGGLPLYLYAKESQCCGYSWREAHSPLPSTWRHATAIQRRGQAAPRRERPPLGSGPPITSSNGHRLHLAGLGLDMDQCPGVLCSFWIGLVGVSLILLRKLALGSAFWWNLPCIYVCDLQNNILQIHVELVNSKCIYD
jgi:hypothetical protein